MADGCSKNFMFQRKCQIQIKYFGILNFGRRRQQETRNNVERPLFTKLPQESLYPSQLVNEPV